MLIRLSVLMLYFLDCPNGAKTGGNGVILWYFTRYFYQRIFLVPSHPSKERLFNNLEI